MRRLLPLVCLLAATGGDLMAQGAGGGQSEERTRVDYQSGLVYHEDWSDGHYLGVVQVESLDAYLNHLSRRALSKSWQDASQKQQLSEGLESDRAGLIPAYYLYISPVLFR